MTMLRPKLLALSLSFAFCLPAEVSILAVTSAASFETGLPPKGSIATIFCRGLSRVSGVVSATGVPLPLTLSDVRVTVGGAPAPLFAVASVGANLQQINIQVPQEATLVENQPAEVRVSQDGQEALTKVPRRQSPGDFFRYGGNYGVFQHASDYSLVTEANPAKPGETIIAYLTGMIGTDPTVPTGQPSPAVPLAVVINLSNFTNTDEYFMVWHPLGSAQILSSAPQFMGLVPGLAGVYQINFQLPEGLPLGLGGLAELDLLRHYCRKLQFSDCRSPATAFFSGRVMIWVGK